MVVVKIVEVATVEFAMVGTKCAPPTTARQAKNGRSSR